MSFVNQLNVDKEMDEEKPVMVLNPIEIDSPLTLLSKDAGEPNVHGENLSGDGAVVDGVNSGDIDEKDTKILETAYDNAENESACVTFGDSLNNDSKNYETMTEAMNVKTNSSMGTTVISCSTTSDELLVHSLKSLNSQQNAMEPGSDVKIVCKNKRGRPRKDQTGPSTSRARESIDVETWETVEPVSDPASGVRRSGRKLRQKRISYIDLLEDNPGGDSNKSEKIDDDEWHYEGEAESLPSQPSSPRSSSPVRKSVSKRKVAVRRREEVKEEEEVQQHQCKGCDQVFESQNQIDNHGLTCNGEISSYCNQIIATRFVGGTKPRQSCPICQKCFSKRNGVKRHLTLKHTNLVHINCALCSKKIGDIDDNFLHFRKEHKNSFPDKIKSLATGGQHCPVCGDAISRFSHVKEHLVNAHSNLIHVTCALCQRAVGTMLEYFQHFVRYHSHSSITRDKNKEVVTTNLKKAMNTKPNTNSDKGSHENMSSSEKSDLVCLQCNKSIENNKLLSLHTLSHKVDENTVIVDQNSNMQTSSVPNSITVQNSYSTSATDSNDQTDSLNPTTKPIDEYPLPVWWLPPETASYMTSASALLGPDLLMAINRSLNAMTAMSTKLKCELDWKDTDYLISKEDLVRKLNKLLQFSSGITDIGKCLLLVLEECLQFKGNPFGDDDDIVGDEDLILVDNDQEAADNETETVNDNLGDDDEDNTIEQNNFVNNSESKESSNYGGKPSEKDNSEKGYLITGNSSSDFIPVERIEEELEESTPGHSDALDNETGKNSELEGSASKNTSGMKKVSAVIQDTERRSSQRLKAKDSSTEMTTLKKGKKKYICKTCGKQLNKKSSLTNHMLVHSEARPFRCKTCTATFKAEDHLKRHILVHLKDERFKCDFCSFSHRTLSLVQRHSIEEHPDAELFSCDQCKHKSKTTHDLAVHKRIHKPRKCKLCDYEARHLSELKTHERKNHADKFCPHCSYSCICKYQLRRHMKSHIKTETDKIFCCELCGATFNTNRKLEYHVIRHTNKTPLECNQCDYKCSSRQSYDSHMLKHSGLRPYKCTLCDADFHRSSYLKQHMLMHSDEKGFCCRYCGKGFKYRYNCQEHEMIHTGEKKFKCKFCNFACRRRKLLDQHVEEHKARGSDVEYMSDDERGNAAVAEISGLMLKTENLVPIL